MSKKKFNINLHSLYSTNEPGKSWFLLAFSHIMEHDRKTSPFSGIHKTKGGEAIKETGE